MHACRDKASIKACLDEIENICLAEIENAKSAIPLVRKNSRLGWEPSMEYVGDEKALIWKIEQLEVELIHLDGYFRHELFWDRDNI